MVGIDGYIPQSANCIATLYTRFCIFRQSTSYSQAPYPYGYFGEFEMYRNRRINHILRGRGEIAPSLTWQKMQNDNYNLVAADNLPYILDHIYKQLMSPT